MRSSIATEPTEPIEPAPPGIDWTRVERRLQNAETYWLVVVRPNGRPYSRPVWGLWHDGALWFGTSRTSVKGRALAANAACEVHLDSGDDVVICEGDAELVADWGAIASTPEFQGVAEDFGAKYRMPVTSMGGDDSTAALYRLRPRIVHAWYEGAFLQTRSLWRLGERTD